MRFLAFLFVFLITDFCLPTNAAYTAGHNHHHDRETTRLPEYASSHEAHREEYTTENPLETTPDAPRNFSCDRLGVFPTYRSTAVRTNVSFECHCVSYSGDVNEEDCPEWKQVDNVLHTHSRKLGGNVCIATLNLVNLDAKSPERFLCVGDKSTPRLAYLSVNRNEYEGKCQEDDDCVQPFTCKDSECDCPDNKPIYLPEREQKCQPVKRLLQRCWNSIQCIASDKNAYCSRDTRNSTEGFCLCRAGFEKENGKCVCSDSIYEYAFSFSKRYQTVFYVLLATSIALILVGLLRLCFIRRRGPSRKMGCVVSTGTTDTQPIVSDIQPVATTENEKPKL